MHHTTRRGLRHLTLSAAAALLSLACGQAQADTIGLHTATWHSHEGYHAATPGLYWRGDNGATAGAYRNSEGRPTAYAGWTWGTDPSAPLQAAITLAAATGYSAAPVVPLIAPSVAWRLPASVAADTTVRLITLPKWHPKQGATAVSLAVEVRL
jgi:hypothetical protein